MKKYIAEFIGSFFILLTGVGSLLGVNFMVSAMGLMLPYGFSSFLAAAAFAATTSVMYYVFNKTSGGHFNPAITLAVFIDEGVKNVKDLFGYIVFQILGSIAAIGCLYFITAQKQNLGQVGYGELSPLYIGVFPAILVELVLTIMIVLVFLTVRDRKNNGSENESTAAIAIGSSVFACYSFGILATGGGLNPAKILASAIFTMGTAIKQLPIFFVVPLIGSVIAFVIFKGLIKIVSNERVEQDAALTTATAEKIEDADKEKSETTFENEQLEDSEKDEEKNEENSKELEDDDESEDVIDKVIKKRGGINDEIQAKLDDEIMAIASDDK